MPSHRSKPLDPTRLFHSASVPVCIIGEDARLAYVNAAFENWSGCTAEELLGQACQFHAPVDATRAQLIAAALAAPTQTAGGDSAAGYIDYPAPQGEVRRRTATFVPLWTPDAETPSIMVVLAATDSAAADTERLEKADDWHAELVRFRARHAGRYRFDLAAGSSPAARRLRAQLEVAQASSAHVVAIGPAGSGRRSAARAVYYAREPVRAVPLATLDGAVANAELLEATLAGAMRASADSSSASRATVLIAEIDRLPLEAQAELWRALRQPATAVRVLATSSRSLIDAARAGEFHAELAYAVSTLEIVLAPLAERRDDVPLLAQAFLEEANGHATRKHTGFSPEALDLLAAYRWPRHVAELVEIVNRAHRQSEGPVITSRDLDDRVRLGESARRREPESLVLDRFMTEIEKEVIARALKLAKGNKARAARLLGLTRPRLYRRMEQLGLEDTTLPER